MISRAMQSRRKYIADSEGILGMPVKPGSEILTHLDAHDEDDWD